MRKFVIKNRQKRKYTRKTEEIPSFSFSKTAYSMVPLLVMLIAFMSTMIISAPLRNAFTNVSFTFQLPQFSLTNPILFFQTIITDIVQIGLVFWTVLQSFAGAISQSFVFGGKEVTSGTFSAANFLTFLAGMIWSVCFFVIHEITTGIINLVQFVMYVAIQCINIFQFTFGFIVLQCSNFFQVCIRFTTSAAITTGQTVAFITQLLIHQTAIMVNMTVHYIIIASIAITNIFVFIGDTIMTMIISAAAAIGSFFTRIALAIIHTIEIPFKVLYAFWLLIKPYADFFGRHVQMSGADFSNMVTSMYKVANIMNSTK